MPSKRKGPGSLFSFVSSFLAFFLWGFWAYAINISSAFSQRFLSALTQGIFSFLMTLMIIRIVLFYDAKLYFFQYKPYLKAICASLFTVLTTGSALFLTHFFIGTEPILKTISLPLSVAFLFSLVTLLKTKHLM